MQVMPGTWAVRYKYMRHGPQPVEGETTAATDGAIYFGETKFEDLTELEHAHDLLEMTLPDDTVWVQIMSVHADFTPALEEVSS